MPSLIPLSPFRDLLPVSLGDATLTELTYSAITSIARGKAAKPEAFQKAAGVAFPAPNRTTGKEGARAIWTGPDQCFWFGPAPAKITGYSLTDQSDGWAAMRLTGAQAEQVLARLTPIDLRPAHFKRGHTARTLMGHMSVSITRTGPQAFDILCFRSMAATAVHEIHAAMSALAGRKAVAGS